jgi:uncharacterized membrane protein YeaQ/YmgE (transglycosylase-associated protein family)
MMKIIASMAAGAAGAVVAVWLWTTYQEQKTNPPIATLTDEED